jgi:hypothetical protein
MAVVSSKTKTFADGTISWGERLRTFGYVIFVVYLVAASITALVGLAQLGREETVADGAAYLLIAVISAGTGTVLASVCIAFSSYILMNASHLLSTSSGDAGLVDATVLAITRDPSLANPQTPEQFQALSSSVDTIMRELEIGSVLSDAVAIQARKSRSPDRARSNFDAGSRQSNGGKPRLGVRLEVSPTSGNLRVPAKGQRINEIIIVPGSPAARANLIPGDELLSVAGIPVRTTEELKTVLSAYQLGQLVDLDIVRLGQTYRLSVEL